MKGGPVPTGTGVFLSFAFSGSVCIIDMWLAFSLSRTRPTRVKTSKKVKKAYWRYASPGQYVLKSCGGLRVSESLGYYFKVLEGLLTSAEGYCRVILSFFFPSHIMGGLHYFQSGGRSRTPTQTPICCRKNTVTRPRLAKMQKYEKSRMRP